MTKSNNNLDEFCIYVAATRRFIVSSNPDYLILKVGKTGIDRCYDRAHEIGGQCCGFGMILFAINITMTQTPGSTWTTADQFEHLCRSLMIQCCGTDSNGIPYGFPCVGDAEELIFIRKEKVLNGELFSNFLKEVNNHLSFSNNQIQFKITKLEHTLDKETKKLLEIFINSASDSNLDEENQLKHYEQAIDQFHKVYGYKLKKKKTSNTRKQNNVRDPNYIRLSLKTLIPKNKQKNISNNQSVKRRGNRSLSDMFCKGDYIYFGEELKNMDDGSLYLHRIRATVHDPNKNLIEYKGKIYSLSGFAEAYTKRPHKTRTYEGMKYFFESFDCVNALYYLLPTH